MNDLTLETAQEQSSKVLQDAKSVASAITDPKTHKEAQEYLIRLRTMRKKWKEVINPVKSQAYKAWQQACDTEREVDKPFSDAENIIIKSLGDFAGKWEENKNAGNPGDLAIILPDLENAEGVYNVETWFCEIVNFMQLIKAVADGKVPSEVLEPSMSALNKAAKALRDEFKIPGCIAVKKTDYRIRTVAQ